MAYPALSETQISSLLSIGERLWVRDYDAPTKIEVIRNAKIVCNVFGWDNIRNDASRFGIQKTRLLQDPNNFDANHSNWFSLGVIFNYANNYIARINGPSMRFLKYAVMCFNDGWGWKQWEHRPDPKEWDICHMEDNPQNRKVCVRTGEDILKKALQKCESCEQSELTVDDRLNLIPGFFKS